MSASTPDTIRESCLMIQRPRGHGLVHQRKMSIAHTRTRTPVPQQRAGKKFLDIKVHKGGIGRGL